MLEFLMSLSTPLQVVFFLIIPILTTIILFIVISKNKSLFLKYGKGEFKIGNGDKKLDTRPPSPHRNCIYKRDIVYLLNKTTELVQQKYLLLNVTQVKQQMKYAEQKIEQIRSMLQKIYLQRLETKGVKELIGSISFTSYRLVLREIQYRFKDILRDAFRDNHFDEMTENGFNDYIKDKFHYMMSEFTELMNDLYYYQEDITREELYTFNKESLSKVKEIIIEIFQNARGVAVDNKIKLLALDEELEKIIDSYL